MAGKGKTFKPYGNKKSGAKRASSSLPSPSKRQTSTKVHGSKGKQSHSGKRSGFLGIF